MFKYLILFFLFLAVNSKAQFELIDDEEDGGKILVGLASRSALMNEHFANWYFDGYDEYIINEEYINEIAPLMVDIKITIVIGTWCSDSRREVPQFYKIMDALKFDDDNIKFIAVDRNKTTELYDIDNLNIKFVPTFIIYHKEKELGRIVENPFESLEVDLLEILLKKEL